MVNVPQPMGPPPLTWCPAEEDAQARPVRVGTEGASCQRRGSCLQGPALGDAPAGGGDGELALMERAPLALELRTADPPPG